ncbi:hypothetical protein QQ045_027894 [Rhodiola kirilowii]
MDIGKLTQAPRKENVSRKEQKIDGRVEDGEMEVEESHLEREGQTSIGLEDTPRGSPNISRQSDLLLRERRLRFR